MGSGTPGGGYGRKDNVHCGLGVEEIAQENLRRTGVTPPADAVTAELQAVRPCERMRLSRKLAQM